MLLRPAFVLALVLDGGDDAGLVIVPAERGNVGQRAELRARPVRRCRHTRPQASAVGKRKRRSVLAWRPVGDRSHNARHAEPVAERRQRRDDIVDEGHVGERVVGAAVEMEMRQPHRVAHLSVHDHHRQDGLGLRRDRLPGAEALEKLPRPLGDRDRAQRRAIARGRGGGWFDRATEMPVPSACFSAAATGDRPGPRRR